MREAARCSRGAREQGTAMPSARRKDHPERVMSCGRGNAPSRAVSEFATTRKRHANTLMREGLHLRAEEEPISFFCECEDERCYQPVWLTCSEYDLACTNRVSLTVS